MSTAFDESAERFGASSARCRGSATGSLELFAWPALKSKLSRRSFEQRNPHEPSLKTGQNASQPS